MTDPTNLQGDGITPLVIEGTQGAAPVVVPPAPVTEEVVPLVIPTAAPAAEAIPPAPVMTQAEWQAHQEKVTNLENTEKKRALTEFTTVNPIVSTEKYKTKWDEALTHQVKGGKYEHLTHGEILNIIRDPNAVTEIPEPAIIPTPVIGLPPANPAVAPLSHKGDLSTEAQEMLEQRYTPEEIANAGKPAE